MNEGTSFAAMFRLSKVEGFVIVDDTFQPQEPADWSVTICKLAEAHVGVVVYESSMLCEGKMRTLPKNKAWATSRIRRDVLVAYLNRMRKKSGLPFMAMTHDKQGGFAMVDLSLQPTNSN